MYAAGGRGGCTDKAIHVRLRADAAVGVGTCPFPKVCRVQISADIKRRMHNAECRTQKMLLNRDPGVLHDSFRFPPENTSTSIESIREKKDLETCPPHVHTHFMIQAGRGILQPVRTVAIGVSARIFADNAVPQ